MQPQMQIKSKVEQITPDYAAKILKSNNPRNRNLSDIRATRYAADMARGHWAVNGEAIIFDEDGNLINGQHRMAGVVKAGVPVQFLVVRGVPRFYQNGAQILTQDTIDRGYVRGVGQQLQMAHGIKNGNNIATAARGIAQFLTGDMHVHLSTHQTLEVLRLYGKSIEAVLSMVMITRLRIGAVMAPLALFHAIEPGKAEDFTMKYVTLENLPAKHPALALNRWVLEHPTGSGADRTRAMKVTTSAAYHFTNGTLVSKLYPSEDAYNWMMARHKVNARKVVEIAVPKLNGAA